MANLPVPMPKSSNNRAFEEGSILSGPSSFVTPWGSTSPYVKSKLRSASASSSFSSKPFNVSSGAPTWASPYAWRNSANTSGDVVTEAPFSSEDRMSGAVETDDCGACLGLGSLRVAFVGEVPQDWERAEEGELPEPVVNDKSSALLPDCHASTRSFPSRTLPLTMPDMGTAAQRLIKAFPDFDPRERKSTPSQQVLPSKSCPKSFVGDADTTSEAEPSMCEATCDDGACFTLLEP
mmetsp:Transcript_148404/g.476602  ORF Transcript_148404/g.476602 Transcript_148404/m.476602 type:complete len:236 (-) Transcript_148404:30-737(-)